MDKTEGPISGYSIYHPEVQRRRKENPLAAFYPKLPEKEYAILYADPPWDYGGKLQYDRSSGELLGYK